jgi:hypothetical protein
MRGCQARKRKAPSHQSANKPKATGKERRKRNPNKQKAPPFDLICIFLLLYSLRSLLPRWLLAGLKFHHYLKGLAGKKAAPRKQLSASSFRSLVFGFWSCLDLL